MQRHEEDMVRRKNEALLMAANNLEMAAKKLKDLFLHEYMKNADFEKILGFTWGALPSWLEEAAKAAKYAAKEK